MPSFLHRAISALVLFIALTTPAWAHDDPAGRAPEQLGKVSFPNSCSPEVQTQFLRAVALLHSFWWSEGRKAFGDVLARDPGCAIAGWGIAAIDIGNPFTLGPSPEAAQDAKQAIDHAREIGPKTERERYYIEAIAEYYQQFSARSHRERMQALAKGFEQVAGRYPDDDEAQIFYAIYLTATQSPTDKTFASALKAASILEVQFAKHPEHPGVAHYLIHSYDFPPIAAKGLNAARRYAGIAPSAPHAQHMPSHIFTRVGAWKDSIAANRRSADIAEAQNEPNDALHALDYMAYAYLQLARDRDADLAFAEAQKLAAKGSRERTAIYSVQAIPVRLALERSNWSDAAKLPVAPSNFRYVEAMTHFGRALGAAHTGDIAAAQTEERELARLEDKLKVANDNYWTTEVEVERMAAAAWIAFTQGKREEALTTMRAAADLEDTSEKAAVSPGRVMPARELLGDMLFESGKNVEALAEYEQSLVRDPNRFHGLYGAGRAAAKAGNMDKAKFYFSRVVELAGGRDARREVGEAREYVGNT